jgi:hypothetical protein
MLDIDQSLGDFMEREELAQLMVQQLLDHINHLQSDLDQGKKARRSTEVQLISTIHKHPASPLSNNYPGTVPQYNKKLRSDLGDGESVSLFSDAPIHTSSIQPTPLPDSSRLVPHSEPNPSHAEESKPSAMTKI